MAKRKRRAFTREFKAEAVRLVRERGKSVPNARARTSGRTSARGPRDHAHHDAVRRRDPRRGGPRSTRGRRASEEGDGLGASAGRRTDRKSTRLNSSHLGISYAVFCLKKKKMND